MSLFGKVLIIFNGLMVGGFLFVAFLDYGRREAWADNHLQYEVVINGLPLDDKDVDLQGNPRTDNLRPALLTKLLGGANVKTQMEELKRVQGKIKDSIDNKQTPKEKIKRLARVLFTLTDLQSGREQLLAEFLRMDKVADDAPGLEDLQKNLQAELDDKFTRVLTLPKAAAPDQRTDVSPDQRKLAFADLLFRLCDILREEEDSPDPQDPQKVQKPLLETKAYERFLNVVGVSTAAKAIDHYATNLQQGIQDVRETIERDRERFAVDYRTRLANIAVLQDRLAAVETFLAGQKELLTSRNEVIKTQLAEKERLSTELKMAQDEAAAAIKKQKAIQDNLYKSRQELRDAFTANQKLEQLLRSYEQDR